MPQCRSRTRDGIPCRMPARRGQDLCVSHDPAYAAIQQQNARRGGRTSGASRRQDPIDLGEFSFESRASVQDVLQRIFVLVLAGGVPKSRRRELIRLASLAVDTLHQRPRASQSRVQPDDNADLTARLQAVLDKLGAGPNLDHADSLPLIAHRS